jgi:hypothetical protein
MKQWRVAYRRSARDDWQVQGFGDRVSAVTFQRSKRGQLWAATLQWWHEGEQRWIG